MRRRACRHIALALLGSLLAVFAACAGGPAPPAASVLVAAGSALSPVDYSIKMVDEPPAESEPGFDIVGPVWDIEGPAPPEGELLTVHVPAPDRLPAGVDPTRLKIAAFHPAAGDGRAYWTVAQNVEFDDQLGALSTTTRGVGLFAAATPIDYWTTELSRDGNYLVHYVSDQSDRAADPAFVDLLLDELEDARRWLVGRGYPEPVDTLGGPQPVYLVPVIGGPGLIEPSNLGSTLKLDIQLYRSPDALPGALTHELFHLSQQRAMFDPLPQKTWIRESTAEFVAVQRLGVSAARPHIDASCDNYRRSVTDTRGINEYHDWTFVSYLERRQPGFVGQFIDSAGGSGDGVDVLRELAGTPLSELLADYARSYRLLREGEVSCPVLMPVDLRELDGRSYRLPPLAGLVVVAKPPTPRSVTLTIETTGDAEVVLWGLSGGVYERLDPAQAGPSGQLTYGLNCPEPGRPPFERIAVVVGSGERPAELQLAVSPGEEC